MWGGGETERGMLIQTNHEKAAWGEEWFYGSFMAKPRPSQVLLFHPLFVPGPSPTFPRSLVPAPLSVAVV